MQPIVGSSVGVYELHVHWSSAVPVSVPLHFDTTGFVVMQLLTHAPNCPVAELVGAVLVLVDVVVVVVVLLLDENVVDDVVVVSVVDDDVGRPPPRCAEISGRRAARRRKSSAEILDGML